MTIDELADNILRIECERSAKLANLRNSCGLSWTDIAKAERIANRRRNIASAEFDLSMAQIIQ